MSVFPQLHQQSQHPNPEYQPPTLLFTGLVLLLALVALGVWDWYVIAHYGRESSISIQVYNLSEKYPIIPIAIGLFVGLVVGHIFWVH